MNIKPYIDKKIKKTSRVYGVEGFVITPVGHRKFLKEYGINEIHSKLEQLIKEIGIDKEQLSYNGIRGKTRIDLEGFGSISVRRLLAYYYIGTVCVKTGAIGVKYILSEGPDGGKHLDMVTEDGRYMTIDHIHPIVQGGSNNISNLQPMLFEENSKKGGNLE